MTKQENKTTPEFFGVVYRIDDVDSGKFYIGSTKQYKKWENGYLGSGSKWSKWIKDHKEHRYTRTVLYSSDFCKTEIDMHALEMQEIRKYCIKNDNGTFTVNESTGCMNVKPHRQGEWTVECPECGRMRLHEKSCSFYDDSFKCHECDGLDGAHKSYCSKVYKCSECGRTNGSHEKSCSEYKSPNQCLECGGFRGQHKDFCSKSPGKCEYCGYSIQSRRHAHNCPNYKSEKTNVVCQKCSGKRGQHKANCPDAKRYDCCGYLVQSRRHSPDCPNYKKPNKRN